MKSAHFATQDLRISLLVTVFSPRHRVSVSPRLFFPVSLRPGLRLGGCAAILAFLLQTLMPAGVSARALEDLLVPEGTVVRIAVQTPVSSRVSEVGDPVVGVLYDDLYVDGAVVLERGAEFVGRVTYIKPARRGMRQAEMGITFDRLRTPYGEERVAMILQSVDDYTNDKKLKGNSEGIVKGGRNGGKAAENTRTGATIGGAAAGTVVLAGQSGGAAAAGAGILGGSALAGLLLTRGGEVKLSPGTILRLRFEQPIKLPIVRRGSLSKRTPEAAPQQ